MEIGIPLPAGKVRAPNIGVSNPLRKRSAVARRGARFVLYIYNGRQPHCRGEQSPAQAQCGSQARSSVCFYIHTVGGYPTVRSGLARVCTA